MGEDGCHRALRSPDTLVAILGYLDTPGLEAAQGTCTSWRAVIAEGGVWRRLARRIAAKSPHNAQVLEQHGLHEQPGEPEEERRHYSTLCRRFHRHQACWSSLTPVETLLCCTPSQVNQDFGFSWAPNWFWANQDGWICSFKVHNDLLLVGVIETLQVWDVRRSRCLAILETPREDLVQGVDFALNCLDLLEDTAVSGSNEGIIRVWRVSTRQFLRRLDCSEFGAVNAVRLTEDLLLSGHDDGQCMVRSISESEVSSLYILHNHPDILWCLDMDSWHLVTCSEDRTICVYPALSLHTQPALQARLEGHQDAVTCVSLREGTLVSGSRDRLVLVWMVDSSSFSLVARLAGHTQLVHYVTMDQERIYSSDQSGELVVWSRRGVGEEDQKPLRRLSFGGRGAIDCIQVRGSQVFTSFDDFGSIAVNDFW